MPYAFAYIRFSDAIPLQGTQASDYYEKALQTRSYSWGGVYMDPQPARNQPMPSRKAASLLLRRVRAGDAVIFPDTSSAFVSQKDFLRVMRELDRVEAEVHLLDLDIRATAKEGSWYALAAIMRFWLLTWDHQFKVQDRAKQRSTAAPFGYKMLGKGRGVKKRLVEDVSEREILNFANGHAVLGTPAQKIADLLNEKFGKNPRAKGRGVFTRLWVEKHITNGDANATDSVPGDQVQADQPADDRAGE